MLSLDSCISFLTLIVVLALGCNILPINLSPLFLLVLYCKIWGLNKYLGKEALQESVKLRVASTLDKSMVGKLEEASEFRAVWVREVVKDIIRRVA
jgi:hypothetical protein